MNDLYQHQKNIIEADPKKCGIFLGTGGGKTRVCLELAEGDTMIIVPKQQKLDNTWQNNAAKFNINSKMYVISKEEFKKFRHTLPKFDTVIIDEAHNFFGVLPATRTRKRIPVPQTSQLFEDLLSYLNEHPPKRLYLATATPVNKPMHLWAITTLLGEKWDFFKFREKYYAQISMGFRQIWIPKKSKYLQDKLAELVKKYGYTGRLQDWFDVPEQTHMTHYVDFTTEQWEAIREVETTEADPMAKRAKRRTIENGCSYEIGITEGPTDSLHRYTKTYKNEKIEYILERVEEFPKLLIFANYTGQIKQIAETLRNRKHEVLTLTGASKDRGEIIEAANKMKQGILIAQCSVSSGYELPTFDTIIFASKSYRYVDFVQACGRVLRANHLKKNLYIHLVVKGGIDELCHKTIESGKDFEERVMT